MSFPDENVLGEKNVVYGTETLKQCVREISFHINSHKFRRYYCFLGKILCIIFCVEKTLVIFNGR